MINEPIKNKIYELCETPITTQTEKELKEILSSYKQGSIGLAQINPIAGDIEYNATKIIKYIKHSQNIGLDLVIFPELALVGYPIEDSIDRHPIIAEDNIKWLNEIAKIATGISAIIGFIEPIKNNGLTKKYYNSLAIITDGEIKNIVRKTILPAYSEFNDVRYIEPAFEKTSGNCEIINGIKYGICVGEDCLNNKEFFNDTTIYNEDPIKDLAQENPDVIINCSAFATNYKKDLLKDNILSFSAKKYSTPIINVNQVGMFENSSFAGKSSVYDKNGKLFAKAKSFEEQFLIINPQMGLGKIYTNDNLQSYEIKDFSLDYDSELENTYKVIIQGIKDYFWKNGFERAVLGLSGGLDSTVCAVLLADALGKENVLGISMPSKITSNESKNDAQKLAENLGINFAELPIKEMFDTTSNNLNKLFNKIETKWDGRYKESYTSDNIQARSRAVILWGISNEFEKTLPIATSDKSEIYVGYATINGDMSGSLAPIADVTKTKLFALAKWLNKNRTVKNTIPESVILKRPGAELAIDPKTGKPLAAEDALMPYEFMDEIIWRIENKKEHYQDMIHSEFLYEKKNSISNEQKILWLDKFYKRMAGAAYKWSILPPSIMIDSKPKIKYDYKQPIISNINYKGSSEEDIQKKIEQIIYN